MASLGKAGHIRCQVCVGAVGGGRPEEVEWPFAVSCLQSGGDLAGLLERH